MAAVKARKCCLCSILKDGLDTEITQCGTLQAPDCPFNGFTFWRDGTVILKMADVETGLSSWLPLSDGMIGNMENVGTGSGLRLLCS